MNNRIKAGLALLAAICVLTVLITPAWDELPSTAADTAHHGVALQVSIIPLVLYIAFAARQTTTTADEYVGSLDKLALICTRLC